MSDKTTPPFVVVEWLDSGQATPEWRWLDDIPKPSAITCLTAGFLVRESFDAIAVAQSLGDVWSTEMQAAGITRIPRKCIDQVHTVENPAATRADARARIEAERVSEGYATDFGESP